MADDQSYETMRANFLAAQASSQTNQGNTNTQNNTSFGSAGTVDMIKSLDGERGPLRMVTDHAPRGLRTHYFNESSNTGNKDSK